MAINNGSSISSVTVVGDQLIDSEDFYAQQCREKHNDSSQSDMPWATNYSPREIKYEDTVPVTAVDPALTKANTRDLRIRSITPSN